MKYKVSFWLYADGRRWKQVSYVVSLPDPALGRTWAIGVAYNLLYSEYDRNIGNELYDIKEVI